MRGPGSNPSLEQGGTRLPTPDEVTEGNLQQARAEHRRFLEAYQAGQVELGVRRSWVYRSAGHDLIEPMLTAAAYPRSLAGLAAILRNLMIPTLLVGVAIGGFYSGWGWVGAVVGIFVFGHLAYRYQREALRQLALEDAAAFVMLEMLGVLVVKGSVPTADPVPAPADATTPVPKAPVVSSPAWNPVPEMRLLFDESGELVPGFEEWRGHNWLDVEAVDLVPGWYPWEDDEGEELSAVRRALYFRNDLRVMLGLPLVNQGRGSEASPSTPSDHAGGSPTGPLSQCIILEASDPRVAPRPFHIEPLGSLWS